MFKEIKTDRGAKVLLYQNDRENTLLRLAMVSEGDTRSAEVMLSPDNIRYLILGLCSTLPDDVVYELADLIRSDAFIADAKARVKRRESNVRE